MIFVAGLIDPACREHFDLHSFQFYKRQVFKQGTPGRSEIVLHRIGQREEIASRVFQSVAQCDEFFPAIDRNQPAILEIALKLFGFDAKIHNIRVAPDEWVKWLNISNGRSGCLPAINVNCSSFAEFNGDNAGRWISAEEQRVLLEFHEPSNFLSFRVKSRNLLG